MNAELLISVKLHRKQFEIQDFISENDFLLLVESGRFSFESNGQKYTVKAGECGYFIRGNRFRRRVLEPMNFHLFRFFSDTPLFQSEHLIFKDQARIFSTISLLNRINRDPYHEIKYAAPLFFDIVNQYRIESLPSAVPDEKRDAKIEAAIARMKKDLSKTAPIEELAREANLSYIQFLRRFKAYTATTPIDYLMSLRLQKAKNMILDSEMQVKEIAKVCGFENEYYFSNFFKKHMNLAPSVFRKTMMQ